MSIHPAPETAYITTADQLRIGDEIYIIEHWLGDPPENGNRYRRVTAIEEISPDHHSPHMKLKVTPEVFEGEPRPLFQWFRNNSLVIIRKS